MAASVLFACGLNESKLPSYVHISEESNMDGSFLISCILGQRLRISNAGTVLVCLQHNYQHYFHAGMRLGYNTNIFFNKTLNVIDPLMKLSYIFTAPRCLVDERQITDMLLTSIREQIAASVTQRNSITILIDNLAVLLNLGATKEELLQLCHALAALTRQYENVSVVTKMSNCDLYEFIDGNVAKLGELHLRVAELKSGLSRDVDGKLLIARDAAATGADGDKEQSNDSEELRKEILYKVNDRNVKIFNPGEVGVRI